ncbi:MAG: methylated-DNA--[protein]-cysteine S-methyltransferase [Parachlamydiaceae bacterium]|nr:methylated-DNA--[protein]-cysteine S-methyltransferase [Parachlamydiaceae bacterium]
MKKLKYKIIQTAVGSLKIVVNNKALVAVLWDNERVGRVNLNDLEEDENDELLKEVEKQLKEYFSCKRNIFDLPLETMGTPFQKAVWEMIYQIPYGSICAYKDIAQNVGKPLAVRAVGTAIGRNPISIIIPCHRVIASNGSLAGFAGGLVRKKILLDLER